MSNFKEIEVEEPELHELMNKLYSLRCQEMGLYEKSSESLYESFAKIFYNKNWVKKQTKK